MITLTRPKTIQITTSLSMRTAFYYFDSRFPFLHKIPSKLSWRLEEGDTNVLEYVMHELVGRGGEIVLGRGTFAGKMVSGVSIRGEGGLKLT